MHDAFKNEPLNQDAERLCVCLLKRQSLLKYDWVRCKRPTRTRWVEHQVDSLASMFHNLPIFIGFANQQIRSPYNKQMKGVKTKLQGMQKQTTNVDKLVFSAIKQDVLAVFTNK